MKTEIMNNDNLIEMLNAKLAAAIASRNGKPVVYGYTKEVAELMTTSINRVLPWNLGTDVIVLAETVEVAIYHDKIAQCTDPTYDGKIGAEMLGYFEPLLYIKTPNGSDEVLVDNFQAMYGINLMDIVNKTIEAMDAPPLAHIKLISEEEATAQASHCNRLLENITTTVDEYVWKTGAVRAMPKAEFLADAPVHAYRFDGQTGEGTHLVTVDCEGHQMLHNGFPIISSEVKPLQDFIQLIGKTPYQIYVEAMKRLENFRPNIFAKPLPGYAAEQIAAHYNYTLHDAQFVYYDDFDCDFQLVTKVEFQANENEVGFVWVEGVGVYTGQGFLTDLGSLFQAADFDEDVDDTPLDDNRILEVACITDAYNFLYGFKN